MLCIQNNNTDPYFNLAAEEHVLKNMKDDCFMLWRNKASVIVGKHQNTLAEINLDFVNKEKIKVVRRLSGGGAVFHDLGNLNFTFIQNAKDDKNLVDFKKYTKPIIEVLEELGLNAKFEGRNDIMIDGKKISGNAEHVFKNRVLHHGTLLFSSLISNLSNALKVNPLKYNDKGVKSVRSRVTNISEHLIQKMTVIQFRDKIFEYILRTNDNARLYNYTADDIQQINQLVKDKYTTWDWNFGYSPKYNFEKIVKTDEGNLEIQLNAEKGIITDIKIDGPDFKKNDITIFENALIGVKHNEQTIGKTLKNLHFEKYFHFISIDEFISAMF